MKFEDVKTDSSEERIDKINTLRKDLEHHLNFVEAHLPDKHQINKDMIDETLDYATEHCFDLTALGQDTKNYMLKINELKEAYDLK